MGQFKIEAEFWSIFPEAKIGLVLARGIVNQNGDPSVFQDLLRAAEGQVMTHLPGPDFSSNDVIRVWRDAFSKFKTKKGVRSSVEALLKRVYNGGQIGNINPLVDIYNSVSLRYALPCGGEDMDTFVGDVRLTMATGNEHFVTLGSDEDAPPLVGEIVYKDDAGAICRSWNWRESVRTMLTEQSRNAFLCIELVDNDRQEDFEQALFELARLTASHLGGTVEVHILDRQNPRVAL